MENLKREVQEIDAKGCTEPANPDLNAIYDRIQRIEYLVLNRAYDLENVIDRFHPIPRKDSVSKQEEPYGFISKVNDKLYKIEDGLDRIMNVVREFEKIIN